jgi:VPDSG-CTERM motif
MNLKNIKTWVIAMAFACMMGTLSHLSALAIGDSLGLIDPNHPASPDASEDFVDILLSQPLGSGPTQIGANFYTRTTNDPLNGNYPAAEFAANLNGQFDDINLGSGFLYLLAKYDGPNYGSVVWYVGGLTGLIDIPDKAGQYGISNTYLFNGVPSNGVPDGGTTLMLLGSALAGLGALRRRFA